MRSRAVMALLVRRRPLATRRSLSMAAPLWEGAKIAGLCAAVPLGALGGGSLVNSAICPRAPEPVLDDWCGRYELSRTARKDLDPHYDAVGDFLGIAPTPDDVQGPRNLLFRDGCDALGYDSEPIARNVRGCRGSGECFTGCRSRAKQSMDISYVPAALRGGAGAKAGAAGLVRSIIPSSFARSAKQQQ